MAGAEAGVSTAVADLVGFTGADFTGADFTPAGFMAADFTPAGTTVLSRACTMVMAVGRGLTGPMAGATGATAGGGVTGRGGLTIRILMAGTTIRITAMMTTTSLQPARLGTIVPIPQAITLM